MNKRTISTLAMGAVAALALAGCAPADDTAAAPDKDITLAVFNGWDEGIAASELWKAVLEEKGYNVELEYADVVPVFAGLASNDYDLTLDVWLPNTHKEYIESFGDDIVDLGAWNEESKLTIAVNEDSPITSLSELADNAGEFNNRIIGIEPGSGLSTITEGEVIPTYGLENMDYITSSTAAMLSELTAATDNGENIVVTLWEPHWAYGAFPIRNLEDPEGILDSVESLHAFGSTDFEKNHAEAAGWISDFEMDLDKLYSLENVLFVENDTDDYGPLVADWMDENRDWVDTLTAD